MTQPTESQIVARVTDRLQVRLPHVPPDRIEEVVVAAVVHFRGSKVRAFVPVLVEREALGTLRHTSGHDAA